MTVNPTVPSTTGKAVDAVSTSNGSSVIVVGPYDVLSPPIKKQMMGGHLLPTIRSATAISMLQQPKRRITIEVYNSGTSTNPSPRVDSTNVSSKTGTIQELNDNDRAVLRVYRHTSDVVNSNSPKNNDQNDMQQPLIASVPSMDGTGWIEHKMYQLDEIQILKERKESVELQLGLGNETIVRDYRFNNTDHQPANDQIKCFCEAISKMKELEERRAMKQLEQYKVLNQNDHITIDGKLDNLAVQSTNSKVERIDILVEIVSAKDLPISDLVATDPYIIVRFGGNEIHRTSVINNNLSPIYTLQTGSLFLLSKTPEEFFKCTSGLSFTVKDYDSVGSNDILGTVYVSLQELLNGTGQRQPYPIELATRNDNNQDHDSGIVPTISTDTIASAAKGKIAVKKDIKVNIKKLPTLYLRFKAATDDNIRFMNEYSTSLLKNKKQNYGIYASETFLPIRLQHPPGSGILNRQEKKNKQKEIVHRVCPCPDPNRPIDETEWMTKEQIQLEAMKPSSYWIKAGTGYIGKLYLEIIGCDDLPNLDVGNLSLKAHREKTDAFACIIYEDVIVNTDVISNTLSPRWMPWCHRAFVFNVLNPSSDIFIGIFDHDPESNPLHMASQVAVSTLHDPVGRLVVNLSHFKPDTVYLLNYPLYLGELKEHRVLTRGTVTIRLRLEFPNFRKAILGGITPPPPSTVSVARSIDFNVAHYTTDGIVDDSNFSLDTITRYIEELQSYEIIIEQCKQAFLTVWLWRGHYSAQIFGRAIKLPLHSMTAFVWAVLVTWDWNRLPAFILFSFAWILLATNEYQRRHPSKWRRCPAYYSILSSFICNRSIPESVESNLNINEIQIYEAEQTKKQQRFIDEKKKEADHELTLQNELGQEMDEAEAAENTVNKRHGILSTFVPDHPLKGVLFPIQKKLRQIVMGIRITKTVLIWKEAYYAFWVTSACLISSAIAIWIPWSFLLRWIFRIGALLFFGPWMAIVDQQFFKSNPNMSESEHDELFRKRLRGRYEEVLLSATNYFQRKERALKLASMKRYMFGKYSVRVPQFCEDLFDDIPLPSSSCISFDPLKSIPIQIKQTIYGQTLKGDMIPEREIEIARSAGNGNNGNDESRKLTANIFRILGAKKYKTGETTPLLITESHTLTEKTTYESVKKVKSK